MANECLERNTMREPPSPPTEQSADSALVVLNPDAPEQSLQAVTPEAAVEDTLYVLLVYPIAEYYRRERAHAQAGMTYRHGVKSLANEASRVAARTARDCLGSDVDVETMGAIGNRHERVTDVVDEHAIEQVYVPGSRDTLRDRIRALLGLPSALERALPDGVTVTVTEDLTDAANDGDIPPGVPIQSDK